MQEQLLKGTCRLSRWTSNRDPSTGVTISLIDELSGSECVEIQLSVEALGMMLTGSQQECEFAWRPKVVGMIAENKTEIVPFDWTSKSEAAIDKALAPFEVDGWYARRSDMTNHHRTLQKVKAQSVVFFRHVDPVTKLPR